MRVVLFCHSLLSDWNHGNAHFLRGIVSELLARGHRVDVFEPSTAWSMTNLLKDVGPAAIASFHRAYPQLLSTRFDPERLDLAEVLDRADLVLVHEWNEPKLVRRIGQHRARTGRYVLLFHDTHHRSATDAAAMEAYDLESYDGVLAFGDVIRERYIQHGWSRRAWTWHEAADTRIFQPIQGAERHGDLVWIGNWGDGERSTELQEFLIDPVRQLSLSARVHGVRYPAHAIDRLRESEIEYGGWLPNYRVPDSFAGFRCTVHIPRRPYVAALPGIPTIRVFEALACGIPLISAPWSDSEGLFTPQTDFLMVHDGEAMTRALRDVLFDQALAESLAAHGLETIRARHTCAHRVNELLTIVDQIGGQTLNDAVPA
jgi:spore maturation protein CgeB